MAWARRSMLGWSYFGGRRCTEVAVGSFPWLEGFCLWTGVPGLFHRGREACRSRRPNPLTMNLQDDSDKPPVSEEVLVSAAATR